LLAQPRLKALAAQRPGFSVTVDDEIGKAGAVACVKEPGGGCDTEKDVRAAHGVRPSSARADGNFIGLRFRHTFLSLRARHEIRRLMLLRIIEPGLPPELTGDLDGVDAGRLPPRLLVAGAMNRTVMHAAERDGEFVAHLAAERPRLQVAKMMRIGLLAATDETRLLGNIAKVLPVAIAPRGSDCEDALVDAPRLTSVCAFSGGNHLRRSNLRR